MKDLIEQKLLSVRLGLVEVEDVFLADIEVEGYGTFGELVRQHGQIGKSGQLYLTKGS